MASIMGSVSRGRSEVNGERIGEGIVGAAEQRARNGRFHGGQRPFGYRQRDTRTLLVHARGGAAREVVRPTGPLVLVPEEADAIKWGYENIARGGTLDQVVRNWRGRGLTGPRGARFTGTAVRDVLLRPLNAGLAFYNGSEIAAEDMGGSGGERTPTIVDPGTWRIVRAILTDPARRRSGGRRR